MGLTRWRAGPARAGGNREVGAARRRSRAGRGHACSTGAGHRVRGRPGVGGAEPAAAPGERARRPADPSPGGRDARRVRREPRRGWDRPVPRLLGDAEPDRGGGGDPAGAVRRRRRPVARRGDGPRPLVHRPQAWRGAGRDAVRGSRGRRERLRGTRGAQPVGGRPGPGSRSCAARGVGRRSGPPGRGSPSAGGHRREPVGARRASHRADRGGPCPGRSLCQPRCR